MGDTLKGEEQSKQFLQHKQQFINKHKQQQLSTNINNNNTHTYKHTYIHTNIQYISIVKKFRIDDISSLVDDEEAADKLLRPFWDFERGCFSMGKPGWEYCCKVFNHLHYYTLMDDGPINYKDFEVYFEDNFTGFLW